jgi:hypothetical protein
MKQFLREFWLWILVPCVLVVLAVITLWLLGGELGNPFSYNL